MKVFKGILLATLVALPVAGFAEDAVTNITWKSSLALGATYKDGNTEKSLFTMNLKGDRFAPKNDWINSLYGEYGKTEGDLVIENLTPELQAKFAEFLQINNPNSKITYEA